MSPQFSWDKYKFPCFTLKTLRDVVSPVVSFHVADERFFIHAVLLFDIFVKSAELRYFVFLLWFLCLKHSEICFLTVFVLCILYVLAFIISDIACIQEC